MPDEKYTKDVIISRTPFRVSFFGGGTDYPDWYLNEEGGGACLSTTIDKYCYISARYLPPFFGNKHRIVWSHIENVNNHQEILHPAIREIFPYLKLDDSVGLEIHHQGDLPARSGMGSSSSFAVGLINALENLRGNKPSKHDLALGAIKFEQDALGDTVGSQDQTAAAYGGMNIIHFRQNGDIDVESLNIHNDRIKQLDENLMMFFTGTSRFASKVAAGVVSNFKKTSDDIRKMYKMVGQAKDIITSKDRDLDDFGRLLDETWQLKRNLAQGVTNSQIDHIYSMAKEAGALGGKLLGAGSSGFMIFYVPKEEQPVVKTVLSNLLHVPFEFENKGSIILQNP